MTDGSVRIVIDAQQAQKQVVDLNSALGNTQKSVNSLQNALTGAITRLNQLGRSSQTASTGASQLNRAIAESQRNYQRSQLAIAQLNAQLQRMQAQMMGMQASITQLQQTHTQAASSAQVQATATGDLSDNMRRATQSASNLHGILLQLGVLYGLQQSIQVLKEFDHAMAQVEAISGATGLALDDLREQAKKLGATTIYTSGEAGQAMKFLAQSGFDVNEILAASGPVLALAQAGDIGLAQAAEIAAKALRGFRLEATEMSDVADVMAAAVTQSTMNITEMGYAFKYVAPIASAMGVNIREASAYIGVLSDAGIDATMAGTALRRIMSELSNPTIKATKLLQRHGLSMKDVDIKARGLTEVLKTLVASGLSVGEVFALFGDRGAPAFQTLAQQVDKVERKIANLQNVTGRAAKMQEVMNQSLFAAFKNLTSALEFLIIQFSEESGALFGLKTSLFSTAEGVRVLARNMDLLAPAFTALLVMKTPMVSSLFAAFAANLVKAEAATYSFFSKTAPAGMSKFAAGAKTATTSLGAFVGGAATAARSVGRGFVGAMNAGVAALGGWPIVIMGAAAALAVLANQESATQKFMQKNKELMDAARHSAEDYAAELKKLQRHLSVMDTTRVGEELRRLEEQLAGMRNQLQMYAAALNDINMQYKVLPDFYGMGGELQDASVRQHYEQIKQMVKEYETGKKSIGELKNELKVLHDQYVETNPELAAFINSIFRTAEAMEVAEKKAEMYKIRLAILTGQVEKLTEAQKEAAASMVTGILGGESLDNLMSEEQKLQEEINDLKESRRMKLNKDQHKMYLASLKTIREKIANPQERDFFAYDWNENLKQVVPRLKELHEMTEEQRKSFEGLLKLNPKNKEAVERDLKAQKDLADAMGEVNRQNAWRKNFEDSLKKGASGAASAAKAEAKALGKVNEELARMTMTDREFQQFKFEEELSKLAKTIGVANPQFQELLQLWEKAKELGLSSPKELINARTSFEDFVAAKQHGGDKGWAKKELIEAQSQWLLEKYKDDAQKRVLIDEWAAEQKNQINEKNLAKDTQSLLNFWDNYMNIAGLYNNQYSELLDKYYQERYQAYKQLCDDEVAARRMAEYDKLKQSRDMWSGFKVATMEWAAENGNLAKQTADIVTNFYDGVADAMYDMVATGKANWEDLGKTVLKQFTMMIIKAMVLANLMKLMGMIGSAIGGAFSGGGTAAGDTAAGIGASIASYSGKFAKGGVFAGGGITDFSSSVVNSPTMFNYDKEMSTFASGGAVMGEAGWEGILPLGRNSRGELGVKADFGGGGQDMRPVIVTIHNYSDSEAREEQGMDSNGNQTIDVIIGDMAASQAQKPGSNLNRVIRNVAGVKQRVTRR